MSIADDFFKILNIEMNNITLKLSYNNQIYPTINILRIQLYFRPRPELFTEPPKDDAEHDYPVDRVMGHKVVDGEDYYYIHWKGYPAEDDSWEPRSNLSKETLKLWENRRTTRSTTNNDASTLNNV